MLPWQRRLCCCPHCHTHLLLLHLVLQELQLDLWLVLLLEPRGWQAGAGPIQTTTQLGQHCCLRRHEASHSGEVDDRGLLGGQPLIWRQSSISRLPLLLGAGSGRVAALLLRGKLRQLLLL